jgi:hypothetical protein
MSNTVFVVKNQHNLYLSKQQEWVDGADNQSLYRTRHRDEAINSVFEVSSRDIYLRAEAVACELDAKGNPALATVQAASSAKIASPEELDMDEEPASADPEEASPEAGLLETIIESTEPSPADHSPEATQVDTDSETEASESIET